MSLQQRNNWILISGLFMVFAGWFSHFGDKSWWELIERPDRIAPLLSSMGALLMRHFGDKFIEKDNSR
jgi:hypothetical protein|tara:strand:+ start:229 stop:432 length:204 start_codon:yes stop_codon:yes gene_type:complete